MMGGTPETARRFKGGKAALVGAGEWGGGAMRGCSGGRERLGCRRGGSGAARRRWWLRRMFQRRWLRQRFQRKHGPWDSEP